MQAVVYSRYGPPDVLRLEEVAKPSPSDDEVLIKVHAVSLNRSDWEGLIGKPLYARGGGLRTPRHRILGSDIAGRVEQVGRNVTRFRPGDEVFGDILDHMGGFAEYVCAPESSLVLKPAGLTFEQAATIPQSAGIALRGIRDKGQVQPGHKVLINGAGGGAGLFAVQLAKHYGAEVTGVDNSLKQEVMRSWGADHVVDYTREDVIRSGKQYDLILDLVAYRPAYAYTRALRRGGRYYFVGGSVGTLFQILLLGPLIRMATGKHTRLLIALSRPKDLLDAAELYAAGIVAPVIDRRFSLHETADALRYLGEGRARGKVIITLESGDAQ
jgi:NADPH:quinone reductase-like Zn-dependent oxidoreductase